MLNRPVKEPVDDTSSNKYYESDIQYTLHMCQWVLKPIGMWLPIYGCTTINEKIISWISIMMCLCLMCFILFPVSYYIVFREKDVSVKLQLLGPIVYCLSSITKYCYLGMKASTFGECIKHIETDWRMVDDPRHRNIMLRNVVIGRHITTINILFFYIGGVAYYFALPLLSTKTIGNITIRPLIFPGYDVFLNVAASPTYEIIFSLHCLYGMTVSNISIAACNLAATFVTHACSQIQIQIKRLESVVQLNKTQSAHSSDPLTIIVMDHIRILRFSGCVEDVLREILLMELASSTFCMCWTEYYCITAWGDSDMVAILTFSIFVVALNLIILIFCYIGELLIDQGVKIGEACYAIDWYNLPCKKARQLLFVMMMSKFPPKLSAGKMFDLSMITFSTILKSSIAYLNLIRTVAE